jgi:integrase
VPLLPVVCDALRTLGKKNPYGEGDEHFIFFSTLPNLPIDVKIMSNGFVDVLHLIGIDEDAQRARGLVFHSLRHCFATAMADRIDQRQAMKATGHRTSVVFEAYADHEREGDLEKIGAASADAFGKVLAFTAQKGA